MYIKVYGFYSLINAPSFVHFKEQRIFTFFFLVMSVGCGHGFQLPFLARVSLFRKKHNRRHQIDELLFPTHTCDPETPKLFAYPKAVRADPIQS